MSIYLKISRVGRDENVCIVFQNGDENCRVGTKKSGSVGLAETQLFFSALVVILKLIFFVPRSVTAMYYARYI